MRTEREYVPIFIEIEVESKTVKDTFWRRKDATQ
jgi:hypothetical protein